MVNHPKPVYESTMMKVDKATVENDPSKFLILPCCVIANPYKSCYHANQSRLFASERQESSMPENASIRVSMMDSFVIQAGDQVYDTLVTKSRRGVSLIQYLILQRGRPVPSQRIIRELWTDHRSDYPESALKTMVSRTRQLLRDIDPALADSLVSGKGSYAWASAPGVTVDVLEIMDILDLLEKNPDDETRIRLTDELLALYTGDLFQTGDLASGVAQTNYLHLSYLSAVYKLIDLLKTREMYNRIVEVCEQAIHVDDLDEQLYLELMNAMVHLNRTSEALNTYKKAEKISQRYFDAPPGEDLQTYYHELQTSGETVRFNLDVIRNELMEREGDRRGPFICDYAAFKEIYNIQMRNLERLGSTMFLAVIMVGDTDHRVSMEAGIAGLMEILKHNLRKGDIVTRYSENIVAMLLPTVNYASGSMVMERIETLFRAEYPQANIPFHARIAPLGAPIPPKK